MNVRIYMHVMYVLYMYVRKNGESKSTYSVSKFPALSFLWVKTCTCMCIGVIDKKNTNVYDLLTFPLAIYTLSGPYYYY